MSDDKDNGEKKCLLDLIPDTPTYSKVFEFGKHRTKYKFRLLDSAESLWTNVAAQRKTYDSLCEEFDPKIALDLMKGHAPNIDLQTQWQEMYALQAALCTEHGGPVCEGSPEERAARVADKFSPIERHELAQLYAEFADEYDPTEISDEQIQEIVAAGGPTVGLDYWKQFGSRALRHSCVILAQALAQANLRIAALEIQIDDDPEAPETSLTPKSSGG